MPNLSFVTLSTDFPAHSTGMEFVIVHLGNLLKGKPKFLCAHSHIPKHVAEFVLFSHALQKKHGVRSRSFGHAGDGNLHIYVLRDDLAEDAWKRTLAAVFEELYAKARELGGQVSGEHGIGYAKKPYLRESLDPAVRALMRGVKDVFDPHHILNPGKVVPGGE